MRKRYRPDLSGRKQPCADYSETCSGRWTRHRACAGSDPYLAVGTSCSHHARIRRPPLCRSGWYRHIRNTPPIFRGVEISRSLLAIHRNPTLHKPVPVWVNIKCENKRRKNNPPSYFARLRSQSSWRTPRPRWWSLVWATSCPTCPLALRKFWNASQPSLFPADHLLNICERKVWEKEFGLVRQFMKYNITTFIQQGRWICCCQCN